MQVLIMVASYLGDDSARVLCAVVSPRVAVCCGQCHLVAMVTIQETPNVMLPDVGVVAVIHQTCVISGIRLRRRNIFLNFRLREILLVQLWYIAPMLWTYSHKRVFDISWSHRDGNRCHTKQEHDLIASTFTDILGQYIIKLHCFRCNCDNFLLRLVNHETQRLT